MRFARRLTSLLTRTRLEKAPVRVAPATNPHRRAWRDHLPVLQWFSSGFGISRHYPVGSHPKAFANGSHREQPSKTPDTGAAFITAKGFKQHGELFGMAGNGG